MHGFYSTGGIMDRCPHYTLAPESCSATSSFVVSASILLNFGACCPLLSCSVGSVVAAGMKVYLSVHSVSATTSDLPAVQPLTTQNRSEKNQPVGPDMAQHLGNNNTPAKMTKMNIVGTFDRVTRINYCTVNKAAYYSSFSIISY